MSEASFERMKAIAPLYRDSAQQLDTSSAYPREIAFKLTNRCNLRCKHCYQWSEFGHHRSLPKDQQQQDLPFHIIEKVFNATSRQRSSVYLWGGEPLLYSDWDKLAELLQEDPRYVSICTNGLVLARRLPSILPISELFEILLAVEGYEAEHDAIRGEGMFSKVIKALEELGSCKREGSFRGEVAVNFVISSPMITQVVSYLVFLEHFDLDTVYVSLPWFISDSTAAKMDHFYSTRLSDSGILPSRPSQPSWYSYRFHLDPSARCRLVEELEKVEKAKWKFKVRFNPKISQDELAEFLDGGDTPLQKKKTCLSIRNRMDVFPDGSVVSCKFFSEFVMGNLHRESVEDIWSGQRFQKFREELVDGLMPVCAQCNLLYSRGI